MKHHHELVVDVETYADIPADLAEELTGNVKADGRLKDPSKILADIAAKQEAVYSRAALSPLTGKVIMIGLAAREVSDSGEVGPWVFEQRDVEQCPSGDRDFPAEQFVLNFLLARIGLSTRFITFNGRTFDMPLLAARCVVHGLSAGSALPIGRDLYSRVIDLRDVLTEGTLANWTMRILSERKDTGDVAKMVDEGRWGDLRERNKQDVMATARIYDRVRRVVSL